MSKILPSQKHLFELEDDVIYLNCSNMSPLLKSAKQAGIRGLELRAKPWNIRAADFFDNGEILRKDVAQVFQTSGDNIALIPSASYGLATAAKNLKVRSAKSILLLENQFPSNYYVWEQLAAIQDLKIITVRKDPSKGLTECILECINSETGIVAIPNCHWMDGARIDLEKISEAVKSVKAFLVLDLSQSLGILPTDINSIDPDFAVSVGYKWMLGPYGLGYMYVAPRWHHNAEPLEYSWQTRKDSDDFTSITQYSSEYRTGARKFDMGEYSQFNTIQMAIAGAKQILEWGVDAMQSSVSAITRIISDRLDFNHGSYAGHIISIPIAGTDVEMLKKTLADNKIFISYRGSFIRISPHLFNSADDAELLMKCVSLAS